MIEIIDDYEDVKKIKFGREKIAEAVKEIAPKLEVVSGVDFINEYTPTDFLIEDIIVEGQLYSLCGHTGVGKTSVAMDMARSIILGKPYGGYDCKKGEVLFMAGENPTDVRLRVLGQIEVDPDFTGEGLHVIKEVFDIKSRKDELLEILKNNPNIKMVIVDTLQAFFDGDDANNNVEMADFARHFRQVANAGVAVLILAHPSKGAGRDTNAPYGGGSFTNEIDGNLALWKNGDDSIDFYWARKFRGNFQPFKIELKQVSLDKAKNSKGEPLSTIIASTINEAREIVLRAESREKMIKVLDFLTFNAGHKTDAAIARGCGWINKAGKTENTVVRRTIDQLVKYGLLDRNEVQTKITDMGKKWLENQRLTDF